MSKNYMLDLKIHKKATAKDIINLFLNNNWMLFKNSFAKILPLKDNDSFNWQDMNFPQEKIEQIVNEKEKNNELVGIFFFWSEFDCEIILYKDNGNEISFSFDFYTKFIDEHNYLIDFNWYAEKIIKVLHQYFVVTHYTFECL